MNRTALFALLVLLNGCAATDHPTGTVVDRSDPVCLSNYDMRSFSPIDNEFIYVEGRGENHYLFTMQRGCLGIRSAEVFAIPDRPGRICSHSFDRVLYQDLSREQAVCRVLDIEQIGSREEAKELAKVRREARREE